MLKAFNRSCIRQQDEESIERTDQSARRWAWCISERRRPSSTFAQRARITGVRAARSKPPHSTAIDAASRALKPGLHSRYASRDREVVAPPFGGIGAALFAETTAATPAEAPATFMDESAP